MLGCAANHFGSVRFHWMHRPSSGLRSFLTSAESGQPERVIDSPCQDFSLATTARAARQCEAWLSPTSAIVALAWDFGTPKAQTVIGCPRRIVQGAFGRSCASTGVGTTTLFSDGFEHGCSGSRAA